MNYTLHQLKVFLKVAEFQSITKASEELHLTQPAVSIQLKKLQDQFDIPLIEIVGRQLFVTDFGLKIAEASKRILKETESIRHTINSYKGLLSGSLKISVVSTGKYVIPYFLKTFMDTHPGVDINIDVSNKTTVIKNLRDNASDFYLVSVLPDDINVNAIPLMENRLYLIGSAHHHVSIKSATDLHKVTLLFREAGSATRNAMESYLKSNEVTIGKRMELMSNEAVKQAVNAGLGVSIMPIIGLRNFLESGSMKIFPLEGLPIITNWNLIYNRGKNFSPAQEAFIDFLKKEKKSIVKEQFSWIENYLS